MAALSLAHFLLWARLTTASPAPSVTPSEGTTRRTSVGDSSSTCLRHKSYFVSVPPFLGPQVSCVCVCLIPTLCVWGLAQLAGSLSLSLPLFLPLSVTLLLNPSLRSSLSPSLLLPGVWMGGMSWRTPETSTGNTDDNRGCKPGSCARTFLAVAGAAVPARWIHSRPGDNLLCTLSET